MWTGRTSEIDRLHPAHPDRAVEELDVAEAVVPEPAKHLGVQELPLVLRRVPVEGVEPAPPPLPVQRDRTDDAEDAAQHGHAIEIGRGDRERADRADDA